MVSVTNNLREIAEMAVKQVVIDDMDQTEGAKTVEFAIDGNQYEIDLTQKNADKLHKALEPFVQAGRRKIARRAPRKAGQPAPTTSNPVGHSEQLNAIRAWAKSNGMAVSDRGRVPQDVVDKFNEAHNNGKAKPEFSSVS